ncbi:E3 ubiquitin-protein ligase XIAP [Astyanax mexicanus]|uniref:RING-type E3 ubiquitin transferase n=1 Tax=Astyanax mexicanus TaxID=7994 RepID=A0A8T2LRS1_ASTMX|nr:E3 ubiquitin-protein ligase XIAP [Astyanax mexicanus]
MRSEEARLRTFSNWPSSSPVQPNDLVGAGLFYVPKPTINDLVQCFCCGGMLKAWKEGDVPWSEHSKFYPNCFFILGHDVGNILMELKSDSTDDGSQDWSAMSTRLSSFQAFPHTQSLSAERLARAGFYFTGQSDQVRCFSCQKTVENWHQGDTPVERHREVSPSCKFLSCAHRRNLIDDHYSESSSSNYDEDAEAMEFRLRTGEIVDESPYPKVPHMKSEEARLMTFSNWPSSSPVQPSDLVQAGLFHVADTTLNDLVQCFCCGGMLSGWEDGDDPWSEHSKFYRNCFFILGHDVGNIPSEMLRLGSSSHRSPLETFEGRLDSFRDRLHPISHERLARAGFYSTGIFCYFIFSFLLSKKMFLFFFY